MYSLFGAATIEPPYEVEKVVNHYDYHATLFHLFGLDAEKLTFTRNTQDKTILDGQAGKIVHDLLDV